MTVIKNEILNLKTNLRNTENLKKEYENLLKESNLSEREIKFYETIIYGLRCNIIELEGFLKIHRELLN